MAEPGKERREHTFSIGGGENFTFKLSTSDQRFKPAGEGQDLTVEVFAGKDESLPEKVYEMRGNVHKGILEIRACDPKDLAFLYGGLGKASVGFAHHMLGKEVKDLLLDNVMNPYLEESLLKRDFEQIYTYFIKELKKVPALESVKDHIATQKGRIQNVIEIINKSLDGIGEELEKEGIERIRPKKAEKILENLENGILPTEKDFGFNRELEERFLMSIGDRRKRDVSGYPFEAVRKTIENFKKELERRK